MFSFLGHCFKLQIMCSYSYKLKAFYKYFLQNSFSLSSFSMEKWQQGGIYTWHLTPLE